MRFEATLKSAIYKPWKSNYIDYTKLKSLLKEDDVANVDSPTTESHGIRNWSDADEGAFVEELVNVQLEKVNSFQVTTYQSLRERTSKCEARLENLALSKVEEEDDPDIEGGIKDKDENGETSIKSGSDDKEAELNEVLGELDSISKEINELEKFSRINFTGFLKAAKVWALKEIGFFSHLTELYLIEA